MFLFGEHIKMDAFEEHLRNLEGRAEAWDRFRAKGCDPKECLTTYCADYNLERCPGTCDYAQKRKDMCK